MLLKLDTIMYFIVSKVKVRCRKKCDPVMSQDLKPPARIKGTLIKANQTIALAFTVTASILWTNIGYAQERSCVRLEAQVLKQQAVMFRTWDALYGSYKSYRQCDDGAIGEGFSESVARILVDHWTSLPDLARVGDKDDEFLRFVLKHVDATLNMDDVQKIKSNAQTECPAGLLKICGQLIKQTDSALSQGESAH